MIHSVRFTCVLDTNVIYPIVIRDILLWFATYELYTPKWSEHIFNEWIGVMESKGTPRDKINKRIMQVEEAFPDAKVQNYKSLIETLKLTDSKDRHVLAAAIKTNANLIITNNIKHFPNDYLSDYGLSAKKADDFIADLIDLNPDKALDAFQKMVFAKRNPDLDEYKVLESLRRNGLIESANYIHALI